MAAGRKLGRGLDSLLANRQARDASEGAGPLWIPVEQLRPNRQQPRKDVERGLEELAESVRQHGLLQPILVTRAGPDEYEILAGERRWRAARKAGLARVPVVVREGKLDEAQRLELALIENIQREDLDPIERALACKALLEEHGLTQEEVARRLGQERSTVANLVRLLDLPPAIQAHVSRGTISAGHARALLRLNGRSEQEQVLKQVLAQGWSVRTTEETCARLATGKKQPAHRARPRLPSWVGDLQTRLTRGLGLRTEIRLHRKGGGRLVIHFTDQDELDRLTQVLPVSDEARELLQ